VRKEGRKPKEEWKRKKGGNTVGFLIRWQQRIHKEGGKSAFQKIGRKKEEKNR
jgi:hypothetical protein